MKAVTVEQMKELERQAMRDGAVSEFELMERAGCGAGAAILDHVSRLDRAHVKRFVILAGKGNNGGDGYVAARYLLAHSRAAVVIYAVCGPGELTGAAAGHAGQVKNAVEIKVKTNLTPGDFKPGDIIIDALLGTGASGNLRPPLDHWIRAVNASGLPVIALDIPSGLSGDTGKIAGNCVLADLTITIGLPKQGLALGAGPEQCGLLNVVDIGLPDEAVEKLESDFEIYTGRDAARLLRRLPMNSHKNSRAKTLVIAGSGDYFGAPFLAALSALRSGSGMVRMAVPRHGPPVDPRCLALIIKQVADNGAGYFGEPSIRELEPLVEMSDVVVAGPGMGRRRDLAPVLNYVCAIDKPLALDADALNVIAQTPTMFRGKESTVLTPHPGEMRRLLDAFDLSECLKCDRIAQAKALAEATASTVALKGHRTVIASPDGRVAVNGSGCPALATAGSGDCLTGVIASFIATEADYFEAAAAAVYVHGLAGELGDCGGRGLIADDIPELIPAAMKKISPFA